MCLSVIKSDVWHQVHLELLYCPFGMENGFKNPFGNQNPMTSLEKVLKTEANDTEVADIDRTIARKKEVITRGVLSVTVISAEDLPAMDVMGKSDPYVVLHMKKTGRRNQTRVDPDSCF